MEQGPLPIIDCSAGYLTAPLVQLKATEQHMKDKPISSYKRAKIDVPSVLTPEAVDFVKWHSGRAAAAIEAAE